MFTEKYELYGHLRNNPIYFSARYALGMMTRLLYSTPYFASLDYQEFARQMNLRATMDSYHDPEHIPDKTVWESIEGRVSSFLSDAGATEGEIAQ